MCNKMFLCLSQVTLSSPYRRSQLFTTIKTTHKLKSAAFTHTISFKGLRRTAVVSQELCYCLSEAEREQDERL